MTEPRRWTIYPCVTTGEPHNCGCPDDSPEPCDAPPVEVVEASAYDEARAERDDLREVEQER